jgi:hypothetical protein
MDLHYLLAPLVRQAIQFPLPAPELAGAGRFLVPYTAKRHAPPEPAAQDENLDKTKKPDKNVEKRATQCSIGRLRTTGTCRRFNAC